MSYFEESVEVISVPSGIDFTAANSSRFVTLDESGHAVLTGADQRALGVMTTNQPAGVAGRVVFAGTVPVESGDNISIGDAVGSAADGMASSAATVKLGVARTAGGAGDTVAVHLRSFAGSQPVPPSFDPASLFSSGQDGGFYDTSDTTALFQDTAGTIPATADGDPVGLVKDLSGNGWDLTAETEVARGTLRFDERGAAYVELLSGQSLATAADKELSFPCTMIAALSEGPSTPTTGVSFGLMAATNRILGFRGNTSFRTMFRMLNPTSGTQDVSSSLASVSISLPYVIHGRANSSGTYVAVNGGDENRSATDPTANTDTGLSLRVGTGANLETRFYGGLYIEDDIAGEDLKNLCDYYKEIIGVLQLQALEYDVFMCGGQSNCSGQGDYLTSVQVPFGQAVEYQRDGVFKALKDPMRHYATNTAGNVSQTGSAWTAFAAKYFELTGRRAIMIGNGVSGLGIATWAATANYRNQMVDKYFEAKDLIEASGGTINNVSMLYLGGEQDGTGTPVLANVKTDMMTIVNAVRVRAELPSMPVYLLSVDRTTDPLQDSGFEIVRQALAEVAAENANVDLVMPYQDFTGQGLLTDHIHWNQTALNEAGEIAATNVADLI